MGEQEEGKSIEPAVIYSGLAKGRRGWSAERVCLSVKVLAVRAIGEVGWAGGRADSGKGREILPAA